MDNKLGMLLLIAAGVGVVCLLVLLMWVFGYA